MNRFRVYARVAATPETLLLGLKLAVLVGCVLNLINQGDLFFRGAWGDVQWSKVMLTFCVPFCVSVYSATAARLRFDPGTRADVDALLACAHCGKANRQVKKGELVEECVSCGVNTDWRVSF